MTAPFSFLSSSTITLPIKEESNFISLSTLLTTGFTFMTIHFFPAALSVYALYFTMLSRFGICIAIIDFFWGSTSEIFVISRVAASFFPFFIILSLSFFSSFFAFLIFAEAVAAGFFATGIGSGFAGDADIENDSDLLY